MATHTAVHGQIVPVQQDAESNTVYAPADPVAGHWFTVKHIGAGVSGFSTIVDGNGQQIETNHGLGLAASTEIFQTYRSYTWHYVEGAWRLSSSFHPVTDFEPWQYTGPNLLLAGATRVPLTFDGIFLPAPDRFEAVGDGTIRALHRHIGFINVTMYFLFESTGNNQDAEAVATINVLAGTATIRQANGVAGNFYAPRVTIAADSRSAIWTAIIEPGAVLELSATDDPLQSGNSYVYMGSNLGFLPG